MQNPEWMHPPMAMNLKWGLWGRPLRSPVVCIITHAGDREGRPYYSVTPNNLQKNECVATKHPPSADGTLFAKEGGDRSSSLPLFYPL